MTLSSIIRRGLAVGVVALVLAVAAAVWLHGGQSSQHEEAAKPAPQPVLVEEPEAPRSVAKARRAGEPKGPLPSPEEARAGAERPPAGGRSQA